MTIQQKIDIILQILFQTQEHIYIVGEMQKRGIPLTEKELEIILRRTQGYIFRQRSGTSSRVGLTDDGRRFASGDSFSQPGTPAIDLTFDFGSMSTGKTEKAIKAMKDSIHINTMKFDLQLDEWKFAMYEELNLFYAAKPQCPIIIIHDFENEFYANEIAVGVVTQLSIPMDNIKIGEDGTIIKGRYLICYYPVPVNLIL